MTGPTMTPLPDNLTDDQRLMLQLGGELPGAASAATASAGELVDLLAGLDGRLRADAAALGLPAAMPAARAVVAAMRSAEAPMKIAPARRSYRPPTWALYPSVAAALLVIGMGGWWYKVHEKLVSDNQPRPVTRSLALVFRGGGDEDLSALSDDRIAIQFDPMVVEPFLPDTAQVSVERQLSALEYLESITP